MSVQFVPFIFISSVTTVIHTLSYIYSFEVISLDSFSICSLNKRMQFLLVYYPVYTEVTTKEI